MTVAVTAAALSAVEAAIASAAVEARSAALLRVIVADGVDGVDDGAATA